MGKFLIRQKLLKTGLAALLSACIGCSSASKLENQVYFHSEETRTAIEEIVPRLNLDIKADEKGKFSGRIFNKQNEENYLLFDIEGSLSKYMVCFNKAEKGFARVIIFEKKDNLFNIYVSKLDEKTIYLTEYSQTKDGYEKTIITENREVKKTRIKEKIKASREEVLPYILLLEKIKKEHFPKTKAVYDRYVDDFCDRLDKNTDLLEFEKWMRKQDGKSTKSILEEVERIKKEVEEKYRKIDMNNLSDKEKRFIETYYSRYYLLTFKKDRFEWFLNQLHKSYDINTGIPEDIDKVFIYRDGLALSLELAEDTMW